LVDFDQAFRSSVHFVDAYADLVVIDIQVVQQHLDICLVKLVIELIVLVDDRAKRFSSSGLTRASSFARSSNLLTE
jgi:hypothetical protein